MNETIELGSFLVEMSKPARRKLRRRHLHPLSARQQKKAIKAYRRWHNAQARAKKVAA